MEYRRCSFLIPKEVLRKIDVCLKEEWCEDWNKQQHYYCHRAVTLQPLTLVERQQLVSTHLAHHGKSLQVSTWDNQLRSLSTKTAARLPLYLTLSCNHLLASGIFEMVDGKDKLTLSLLSELARIATQRYLKSKTSQRKLHVKLAAYYAAKYQNYDQSPPVEVFLSYLHHVVESDPSSTPELLEDPKFLKGCLEMGAASALMTACRNLPGLGDLYTFLARNSDLLSELILNWNDTEKIITEMEDQRIYIKFCVKNGFKGAEIFWMLQTAYGDAIMSQRRVFEWYKRFKEGREETADNERSGRPSTSTTPEKVDKVLELRVITGDETWIYGFDSETTQQASDWRFKNEPRPKKVRKAPSKVKVMLTVFFDYQGIVHHEFQQQGSTITADSYLGVLRRLRKAIRQKWPELWRSKSQILHHDNAPAHTALKIFKFLQDHSSSIYPQLLAQQVLQEMPSSSTLYKTCASESIEPILVNLDKTSDDPQPCVARVTLPFQVLNQTVQFPVSYHPQNAVKVAVGATYIAVGCQNGSVLILSQPDIKVTQTLLGHTRAVTCLYFTSNSDLCTGSEDGTLALWDLKRGCRVQVLEGHTQRVTCCLRDIFSRSVLSTSWDGTLRIWYLDTVKFHQTLSQGIKSCVKLVFEISANFGFVSSVPINTMVQHPDLSLIVTGTWRGGITIWDLTEMARVAKKDDGIDSKRMNVIQPQCPSNDVPIQPMGSSNLQIATDTAVEATYKHANACENGQPQEKLIYSQLSTESKISAAHGETTDHGLYNGKIAKSSEMNNLLNDKLNNSKRSNKMEQRLLTNIKIAYKYYPEFYDFRQFNTFINTRLNNHSTLAVVDTGATVNLIKREFVERCGFLQLVNTKRKTKMLGTGNQVSIGSIDSVRIQIGEHTFLESFFVMESIFDDIILGMRFIGMNDVGIFLAKNVMVLQGTEIPFATKDEIGRSTWMTEWHRVVFSDESRFCLSSDSRRVRVWRRRGERSNLAAIVERPTVRQRGIMVWGAIAYDSRSPLLRIQGTMTAQRYVDDVLRPVTLPYLQGVPNAIYQQDNARPHTARISQQALQDVQMLHWPPYSPDLSPIEHVWDIIGRRLHA
ncbi:CLCN3 [Cordylochernes scorpioides]|uniref:CLCN3 n=1 Tax=Cordylochernes scorpioides TaxID=51811 RepID=A0ABY6KN43_9ARAC|nr:CLCN3 [Cordylochernes scorpioides]